MTVLLEEKKYHKKLNLVPLKVMLDILLSLNIFLCDQNVKAIIVEIFSQFMTLIFGKFLL